MTSPLVIARLLVMSRASQSTLCPCGHSLSSASPLVGYVDADGFRAARADASHVLVNCLNHAIPQTRMLALSEAA